MDPSYRKVGSTPWVYTIKHLCLNFIRRMLMLFDNVLYDDALSCRRTFAVQAKYWWVKISYK